MRKSISNIHNEMEHILYNANLAIGPEVPAAKMIRIRNMIQELEKATIGLGTAVTTDQLTAEDEFFESETDRKPE